jgi:hypothetical protein
LFSILDVSKDGKLSLSELKRTFVDYDFCDLKDRAGNIINDLREIIKHNKLELVKIFGNFDKD